MSSPIGPYRLWQYYNGKWQWGHAWPIVLKPGPLPSGLEYAPNTRYLDRGEWKQPDYVIRNHNHKPIRPYDYRNADEEL
jgi:hypothetical protein